MEIILEKAADHYHKNLPFVLFCKPNSNEIRGFFQNTDALFETNDFTEKGFVFSSFDGCKNVLFPQIQCEIIDSVYAKRNIEFDGKIINYQDEHDKIDFENLVRKGIQAIINKDFQKVVLSRKQSLKVKDFNLLKAFDELVQLYSNTFVYCFYHPKIGTWLGATPEQLLKVDNEVFKTIALAGTQKDSVSSEITWQRKEQEEQQIVTDYIVEKLKSITTSIAVSKPYSLKAGSVWHIKTDISGVLNLEHGLKEIIGLLHPTPAVCGLPKLKAKAFIIENENYNRTFYTGFLGELNMENQTDLFVNLRCTEVDGNNVYLFMGCGITKDSIPEKEWDESVNKSATIIKVLDVSL